MLKITPGSIESDGHVVLLPAGLTGQVTTGDGRTYDLGPAHQIAIGDGGGPGVRRSTTPRR